MEALINGVKVPSSLLGSLKETRLINKTDEQLRNSLNDDGYLLLRDVIDKKNITKARNDVFEKLNNVGELTDPFTEGISCGEGPTTLANFSWRERLQRRLWRGSA